MVAVEQPQGVLQVLIVEDAPTEQKLMATLLTGAGYAVATTASAEEAQAWLAHHPPPDVVVLDIMLPGDNGLSLCRHLRAHPDYQHLPIIFCSSKTSQADRFWALKQGGNDYLTKPYSPRTLLAVVAKYATHV
ncbi:MAG: response regulator [Gloeomargaritaceae cyanobacterium C42_A2020_066]|nr:response regulator [Gloeomargaritaceae cyanobacterium C42_A2020_066]